MSQDPSAARSLPAHGAFVVQFNPQTDVARGQFIGRIEHVVSGQATHFDTLEACLAFVERVLATCTGSPLRRSRAVGDGADGWRPPPSMRAMCRE